MRSFSASACSSVRRPAAWAASIRFFSACFSAFVSSDGWTPSCFAASSTTALLSSDGEPAWVAA